VSNLKVVVVMDNLEQVTYKSLQNYFKALELYGFKGQSDVDRLLALVFIYNFIAYFNGMFTREDTTMFERAFKCLTNSTCLIENNLTERYYYSYQYNVYASASTRVTEDLQARLTEDYDARVVE
jgi:hypothetical protein